MGAKGTSVHGIDVSRVEAAVRRAELGTSGEIRVCVARFYSWGDVRRAAERAFRTLRMDRTQHRNGVLIYVAPRMRRFVVLGDAGIDRLVEPTFWSDLCARLGDDFRAGERTWGLERAIADVGDRLRQHFPAGPGPATNELPDQVARDR